MKTHHQLPKSALSVMRVLEDHGYEVYLIGGYVRDLLIGRPSYDLDMATNASTTAMIGLFSDHPLSLIGEKLGTVGVKVNGAWIEITTYRSETTSSNYRHPDEVRFIGSLKDDVLRRDFTINALALNIYGDLIDYTEGLSDLKLKRIRAIGDPDDRFREDALRILRALRFSAQLGFEIDPATSAAMRRDQALIMTLPIERIAAETDKLIMAAHPQALFERYPDILKLCLDFDPVSVCFLERFEARALRYLCLLDPLDPGAIATRLSALKCAGSFIRKVIDLKTLSTMDTNERYPLKILMGRYGVDLIEMALTYQRVRSIKGIDAGLFEALKAEGPCVTLKGLAINGDDLIALGCHGKKIKSVLENLLDLVMRDMLENDRQILIQAAKALS